MVGKTVQDEHSELALENAVAPGLQISGSPIEGQGCFATVHFHTHQLIAEYAGEKITFAEAERRRGEPGRKSICDVDLVWSIDGRRGGNGTQYINHSCSPSCYLRVERDRILLFAQRNIFPGEEITADYFYELKLEGRKCRCRSSACMESE
jgi:SET domain-containing protein